MQCSIRRQLRNALQRHIYSCESLSSSSPLFVVAQLLTAHDSARRSGMFAQGSTSSPFRSSGQQGLFSTPQQQTAFGQSSSTGGYGGYSNTSSSTPNTFAGPQFGGGNHGAAYGGQFSATGAGVGGGGAGGAGYGSPFGGAGGMQGSTGGATGTPGTKRSYLPGYLSGGVAAQVRCPPRPSHARQNSLNLSPCSKPSRLRLNQARKSGRGTRPHGGRLCRGRPSLALAAGASLAGEMSGSSALLRLSEQMIDTGVAQNAVQVAQVYAVHRAAASNRVPAGSRGRRPSCRLAQRV